MTCSNGLTIYNTTLSNTVKTQPFIDFQSLKTKPTVSDETENFEVEEYEYEYYEIEDDIEFDTNYTLWEEKEVAKWLESIGFPELIDIFKEQGITGEFLQADLTVSFISTLGLNESSATAFEEKLGILKKIAVKNYGFWNLTEVVKWLDMVDFDELGLIFEEKNITGNYLMNVLVNNMQDALLDKLETDDGYKETVKQIVNLKKADGNIHETATVQDIENSQNEKTKSKPKSIQPHQHSTKNSPLSEHRENKLKENMDILKRTFTKSYSEWTQKEVQNWLKTINFSQLIPRFQKDGITGNFLMRDLSISFIDSLDLPAHRKAEFQKNLGILQTIFTENFKNWETQDVVDWLDMVGFSELEDIFIKEGTGWFFIIGDNVSENFSKF